MKDTKARTIAMIHTSRGLTPPKGPIGSPGMIGKAMKVMASSNRPERNSGQLIFATSP